MYSLLKMVDLPASYVRLPEGFPSNLQRILSFLQIIIWIEDIWRIETKLEATDRENRAAFFGKFWGWWVFERFGVIFFAALKISRVKKVL